MLRVLRVASGQTRSSGEVNFIADHKNTRIDELMPWNSR